ncbi:MAG: YybH family protein [Chitinophagales bacterium]
MITIFNLSSFSQTTTTPLDLIKKYERLVLEMKADSLSQLFTTDAEVGHEEQPPVKGRDSICRFLSSFKNVRVIRNVDSIIHVSVKNDSAIVEGIYKQTVIISKKDTVNVSGHFTSNLILDKNKNWLISRMHTRSL